MCANDREFAFLGCELDPTQVSLYVLMCHGVVLLSTVSLQDVGSRGSPQPL